MLGGRKLKSEVEQESKMMPFSKMINIDGTRNIVDQCKIHSTKMIFLSSDFVFDVMPQ